MKGARQPYEMLGSMDNKLYYYALNVEARSRTQNALNARILREPGSLQKFDRLTLCSIVSPDMPSALEFATEEWPKHYAPETFQGFGVSWYDIVVPKLSDPDVFELAIWQEVEGKQVLAALAFGNPSHARSHLTVKWVERFYGHTYVGGRVLLVVLSCAEEYAKLLGSQRVLIKDPLVPQKYERYGYTAFTHPYVPHGGNYMAKELGNG